jgi:tetratricopeptide (TPR) repeat protein
MRSPLARRTFSKAHSDLAPRALALLAGAGLFFTAQVGHAQAWLTLFDEGKKLADAGKYAEACPKFEAAHQIKADALGISLNLAVCYKNIGKSASAWSMFKEASFLAKKANEGERATFAEKEAAALEPTLSRLQVDAEDTPGLIIRVDDKELAKGALGSPIPTDPGDHKIEATAPGYLVWSTGVHVGANKDLQTLKIPSLKKGAPLPGAAPAGPNPAPRGASYAVGGLGVAGLAVGGIFGGLALSAKSKLADECKINKTCTTKTAQDDRAAASTKATVSTIGFAVGGAALATGIVLFAVSGRAAAPAEQPRLGFLPAFGPEGGSFTLTGRF